jgi:hypothetical protein
MNSRIRYLNSHEGFCFEANRLQTPDGTNTNFGDIRVFSFDELKGADTTTFAGPTLY